MGNEPRLTVAKCWHHLQRIDEALLDYSRSGYHNTLMQSREFFVRQLERCLGAEGYPNKEEKHER